MSEPLMATIRNVSQSRKLRRRRGGFFLVLVLIVIVVATLSVYSFTELMIAQDDSAYLAGDLVQARVNTESAIEAMRIVLSQPPDARDEMGGVYSNPALFQAITVSLGTDNATPSNYTVVAPGIDETGMMGGIRFGLQDESARLNINTLIVLEENSDLLMPAMALTTGEISEELATQSLPVSLLMALPGMTEDVADAILDWIDEDEEARPYGAEADYYMTLPTPYAPANGPLHSVEELLLVRGVTPTLLFGVDANRNGVVDADEQVRYGIGIETPGALGWASYLTVSGAEANKRSDGTPTVKVNQDDLELLYQELSAALGDDLLASYITAYRIGGVSPVTSTLAAGAAGGSGEGGDSQNGSGSGGQNRNGQGGNSAPPREWSADVLATMDLTGGGGTNINQVLDLIDSTVTVGEQSYLSPFKSDPLVMASYMPLLMDVLSTQDTPVIPGRININECPAELLYGVPLLEPETVDAILEARQNAVDDPNRKFETWPLVEGIVSLDQMRQLLPLFTGGGDVFRGQIVGYYEIKGASKRVEVIIDATTVNPKIISWRDLSHLGRGFELSVLGLRTAMPTAN